MLRRQPETIDWSVVDFSKSVARSVKRQSWWTAKVFILLSTPLLIASGMLVFMYFYGLSTTSSILSDARLSYSQEERKVRVCSRVALPLP